mgnify:CR=1 FL=1
MARSKSFSKSITKSFSNMASGKGFFKNKIVLYVITFIALMNLFGYVLLNNYNAVTMFLAVGLIVFNFNKNMIIVLLCCLLATNLYVVTMKPRFEGFKAKGKQETSEKAAKDAEVFASKTKKGKKKSGFQNQGKNVVAKTAAPVKDDSEEVKSRIDYGTTIERAYDNLDNILGGQNMQKLTKDTTRLIEKQNKLVKNMQGMAPMITQYKDLLKNMNLDSIQNLATKLTGSPLSLNASSNAPTK